MHVTLHVTSLHMNFIIHFFENLYIKGKDFTKNITVMFTMTVYLSNKFHLKLDIASYSNFPYVCES